jgi:ribosomal protein S19E (S16A)
MNRVQKQEHLAQANRHIAELAVQILRQRGIVKHALDTGQRSEMAESLLDALEGSLRLFEKHRILVLGQLNRRPSEQAARPPGTRTGGRALP